MKVGEIMYKNIFLILSVLFFTGCQSSVIQNNTYSDCVSTVLNQENVLYNTYEKGYRFYLPRDFNILETGLNSHILVNNSNKYYLNVGIISFYNLKTNKYMKNEDVYYAEEFTYKDKYGYLEIKQNNGYFYIKMMYNYSIVEVMVQEKEIRDAIIYSSIILSSIDYNRLVIEEMVKEYLISNTAKPFELTEPKNRTKTYLDYNKKRNNENDIINIKDPDIIN